jgi:hypothetical protein
MKMASSVASRKAKARRLQQKVVALILEEYPELTERDVKSVPMGVTGADIELSQRAFDLFPFSVECFSGDTLVVTKNGMVPIKDLNIGDKVVTHLGRFRKITNVFKRKASSIMKLTHSFSSEPVHITPEHPIEDFYGDWVYAKDAKITSHLFDTNNDYITSKKSFICPKQTHKLQHTIPDKVDIDKSLMFLFGWYIAEGHCDDYRVVFTLSKEENDIAILLKNVLESKFNVTPNISYVNNTVKVSINSTLMSTFFKKTLGTGSKNKKLGELIYYDKSLLSSLLQAYFKGDGCVSNEYARCETVSRTLAYEIQYSLLRYGIVSRVSVATIHPIKRDTSKLYSVQISKSSLDKFLSLYRGDNTLNNKLSVNHLDKIIYAPYKQRFYGDCNTVVDESYNDFVYNIEVEEDESYIIESGMIVHNCKNQEKLNIWDSLKQAESESRRGVPLLVFSRNNTGVYCALKLNDFIKLLKK